MYMYYRCTAVVQVVLLIVQVHEPNNVQKYRKMHVCTTIACCWKVVRAQNCQKLIISHQQKVKSKHEVDVLRSTATYAPVRMRIGHSRQQLAVAVHRRSL